MKIKVSSSFYPLFGVTARYLLMIGGSGSGKSEFAARKIFKRCQDEGHHRVLIVRKVRRTLKDSAIRVILQILEDNKVDYEFNKSDLAIAFGTSELLFYGLDDILKLKSIKGVTMIWIEEATEIMERDFTILDLTLREPTKYYKQIMMSFNPEEAYAPWLKDMFFEDDIPKTGPGLKKDSYIHHSTVDDNPIPEVRAQYLAVLDDIKDKTYKRIYRQGLWAMAKGRYFNWKMEPLPTEDEDWYDEIFGGGDFGFSINPAAFIKIYRKGDRYWLKEIIFQLGLTNRDLAKEIIKSGEFDPKAPSYWDSAEPKSIQELIDEGMNALPAEKGKDSVDAGLDLMMSLNITIVEGSDNLYDEHRSYKRMEDKYGNPLPRPVKFKDNTMDASRYGIFTHYNLYLRPSQKEGRVHRRRKPQQVTVEVVREETIEDLARRHRQPPSESEKDRAYIESKIIDTYRIMGFVELKTIAKTTGVEPLKIRPILDEMEFIVTGQAGEYTRPGTVFKKPKEKPHGQKIGRINRFY